MQYSHAKDDPKYTDECQDNVQSKIRNVMKTQEELEMIEMDAESPVKNQNTFPDVQKNIHNLIKKMTGN